MTGKLETHPTPAEPSGCRTSWHLRQSVSYLDALVRPWSERPLLCLLIGLAAGSWLGTSLPPVAVLVAALLMLLGLIVLRSVNYQALRYCCRLGLSGLVVTCLHLTWQARALPPEHIVHQLQAGVVRLTAVEGSVDRALETIGDRQRLYLRLLRWQQPGRDWQPVSGLVRLSVHAEALPFFPGDTLRIDRLRLYQTRGQWNPGGFNLQAFMQRQGVHALGGISNPGRVTLLERPAGFHLRRWLEHWRQSLYTTVRAHLPPPYDAVFLAMVLGQRGYLPTTVQQDFRTSGTAHLLVVSGLHVAFITSGIFCVWRLVLRRLRSRLPRAWCPGWRPTPVAALLSLPLLLLYCSIVGWHIPATRAALMAGLCLLAFMVERRRDAVYALIAAAVLLLMVDPLVIFDLGFQLSFAAVAAILLVSTHLPQTSTASGSRRWFVAVWHYTLISGAAYSSTLPLLATAFHTVSTYGILANLLLVPVAGIFVPLGAVTTGVTYLWPASASVLYSLLQLPLAWLITGAAEVARLPGAQLHLAAPSRWMVLAYYAMLGSLVVGRRRRWQGFVVSLALLGLSSGWHYLGTFSRDLQITFLDVGTGDAIVVRTPERHHLLIDGGGTYDGRFDIGAQVVAPFLWDHYIRRFDFLALTHTHPNHARGLASVLRLFPAQHLLTNGSPMQADYLRDLLAAGKRWGTQHHSVLQGPRHWQWERLHLTVLAPPDHSEQQQTAWQPAAENDRSLVMRLQYGKVRLLLTGDIQHVTERWLLAHREDLRADILQVPHHGSKTSTSPAFVQRVRPRDGIISLGVGYGHPHPQVLQTLAAHQVRVWRTDHHGAITISSDGTSYRITPFRP